MTTDTNPSRKISFFRVLVGDFAFGFLIYPLIFSVIASIALACGFSYGRRGRAAVGPEQLPLVASIAGILFLLVIVAAVARYFWFNRIAKNGTEVVGTISNVSFNGINILEYEWEVDGKKYSHRHYGNGLFIPKTIPEEGAATLIMHRDSHKQTYVRDLLEGPGEPPVESTLEPQSTLE